jgi:hypothetical protein
MPVINKPNQHFDINLYSGNSGTQTITNSGLFQPDFVWSKCRNVGRSHRLCNSVGGSTKEMYSDVGDAEQTDGSMTSFTSTGFNLNNATGSQYNTSGENYVSWQWKAGGTAVTNTAGSITSQVSANPTAGFSVVTFTGNNSTGTVGHGLGAAPRMIIQKPRSASGSWAVYHASIGASNAVWLNLTDASSSYPTVWNSTDPTSSVYSVGSYMGTATYVAYCFAQVAGYSAFGSYTGNGSADGPFVYTGFRPRFVMIKQSSSSNYWWLKDSARSPANQANLRIAPNLSNTEADDSSFNGADFLSNGFKLRGTDTTTNQSSGTYIYMAFAEAPFKYANAR